MITPTCPDNWFAVYPCGSKLDLCASFEDKPAAFFANWKAADEFAKKYWPNYGEVLTAAQANAKPTTQAEEMALSRTGRKDGAW